MCLCQEGARHASSSDGNTAGIRMEKAIAELFTSARKALGSAEETVRSQRPASHMGRICARKVRQTARLSTASGAPDSSAGAACVLVLPVVQEVQLAADVALHWGIGAASGGRRDAAVGRGRVLAAAVVCDGSLLADAWSVSDVAASTARPRLGFCMFSAPASTGCASADTTHLKSVLVAEQRETRSFLDNWRIDADGLPCLCTLCACSRPPGAPSNPSACRAAAAVRRGRM